MPFPRDEIEATIQRYVETRKVIDDGGAGWSALAQYFTDDAVFIDPAWGRVEGIDEMKATVFGDAMVGFEEWSYLVLFVWIALAGAGPLSLDHLIARRLDRKNSRRHETAAA